MKIHVPFTSLTAMCFACLAAVFASAQGNSAIGNCTLRVHVDGLRNTRGVVGTVVFASPAGWPDDVKKSVRHEAAQIDGASHAATIVYSNMPAGNYAIVALHDENKNMKLDKNLIGWPKEGFGFANNPHVGIRPPPFAQAVLHFACPVTETTIHIVYK